MIESIPPIPIEQTFDDLKDENNRLINDLCFDRNLIEILENIKNYSLVLINNCKCLSNEDISQKIRQLYVEYEEVRSRRGHNPNDVSVKSEETDGGLPFEEQPNESQINDEVKEEVMSNEDMTPTDVQTEDNTNCQLITEIFQTNKEVKQEILDEMIVNFPYGSDHKSDQKQNSKRMVKTTIQLSDELNESQKSVTTLNEVIAENSRQSAEDINQSKIGSNSKSNKNKFKSKESNNSENLNKSEDKPNDRAVNERSEATQLSEGKDRPSDHYCVICSEYFDSELDFEIHSNQEHKDIESFVCHECKQIFNTRELLTRHLRALHESRVENQIKCNYCETSFHSERLLDKHMYQKHKAMVKKGLSSPMTSTQEVIHSQNRIYSFTFRCDVCDYETSREKKWIRHKRTHSSEESIPVSTPVSTPLATTALDFKSNPKPNEGIEGLSVSIDLVSNLESDVSSASEHAITFKPNEHLIPMLPKRGVKRLPIDLDTISISSDISEIIVSNEKKKTLDFVCSVCKQKCESFIYLKTHCIFAHNKRIPEFRCEVCDRSFDLNKRLVKHLKRKHNLSQFSSLSSQQNDRSIQSIQNNSDLKKKKKKKNKRFKSDPINKSTNESTANTVTQSKSSTNKSDGSFKRPKDVKTRIRCELFGCDKLFESESVRRQHYLMDHYICDHLNCDEEFTTADALQKHRQKHSKRVVCSFKKCKKSFEDYIQLKSHIFFSHS